jgi:hypothetical protein
VENPCDLQEDRIGAPCGLPTNVRGGPIERDLDSVYVDDQLVESLKREVPRPMGYPA